jgi:N-acetylmuramic acid 6-phosphate etherase
MVEPRTEQVHQAARGLDARPLPEIAAMLAQGQVAAAQVVAGAADALAQGGAAMAATLRAGGALHYGAAGSSGLMALADACELAGTFGIDPGRVHLHMAGGIPQDAEMPGDTEDDRDGARRAGRTIRAGDAVIVLSASGTTPFVLELADAARAARATLIGIANNPDAPLLGLADVAICLPTPPEVLAGSTRMGAGTAQKAALNILSTLMGVALGHVHDGLMVNVRADNAKLRARAAGIVAEIAGVDAAAAQSCLDTAGGAVKPAVLLAAGAADLTDATGRLARADGNLRAALTAMIQSNRE